MKTKLLWTITLKDGTKVEWITDERSISDALYEIEAAYRQVQYDDIEEGIRQEFNLFDGEEPLPVHKWPEEPRGKYNKATDEVAARRQNEIAGCVLKGKVWARW